MRALFEAEQHPTDRSACTPNKQTNKQNRDESAASRCSAFESGSGNEALPGAQHSKVGRAMKRFQVLSMRKWVGQ